MLPDPLVLVDGVTSRSLPRSSGRKAGVRSKFAESVFKTPEGDFVVYITRSQMGDESMRTEIILERNLVDTDGPFVGTTPNLPNRFGFVIEANRHNYESSTAIPHLRGMLENFVSSAVLARLIGGEI